MYVYVHICTTSSSEQTLPTSHRNTDFPAPGKRTDT